MNGLTNLSQAKHKPDATHRYQFCSMEYRQQGWEGILSRFRTVVLIVLCDEEGKLRFFVHPNLRTVILEEDVDYIQSLLADFLDRATRDPVSLFKQLSSIGMGSLVTQDVGSDIASDPSLEELLSKFVELY